MRVLSSGDAELSSEPYVRTYYTTLRLPNPEAFYLLGHGLEPLARVPKMARVIPCCSNFYFFCPTSTSML